MTDNRVLITIDDEHGQVRQIIDVDATLDALEGWERELVEQMASAVVDSITWQHATLSDTDARLLLISELVRRKADVDAYQREAERRGVLPL